MSPYSTNVLTTDNVILVFLHRFDCLAHLNVIPSVDVGKIQDELSEILAKRYKIDHYEIITSPDAIFIYPIGKSDSTRHKHNLHPNQQFSIVKHVSDVSSKYQCRHACFQ